METRTIVRKVTKSLDVKLGKIDDVKELFNKAENQLKEVRLKANELKKEISRALIITDQNIPAQAESALKLVRELGIDSAVQELQSVINKSKKLTDDFMPLYKSL